MASSKPAKKAPEPVEWDLSESFGILPEGLPLSHNLGCVRSPKNDTKAAQENPELPSPAEKTTAL